MRATLSLIRREFSAYFLSPIGFVVMAVFLVVTGQLFYLTMELLTAQGSRGIDFPMQRMLTDRWFWLVFLFIPPLLTMRLFAEERGSGTLEMLLTAPVKDWQIVLSKFAACFLFYVLMWVPTLVYFPVLTNLNIETGEMGIDPWPVAASYLGLMLAGLMFLALGLFVSSLFKSQMVAALVSLALGLLFLVVGFWRPEMDSGSLTYQILFFVTVPLHFERNFTRGIIDTRQIVLYVSVAVFFLFLTIRSLESRRWR
ncbi:MAG: ABC transporter permease [Gemmataceae bacterium]